MRPSERREKIDRELAAYAKKGGYQLHEDTELLKLVTYLNEYPSVIQGGFDTDFLSLPDEILITVMREHQKYFAVEKRNGELAANFLAVINLDKDPKGLVRAGHERVLRARFADAQFFWSTDLKCRLADYLPKLAKITYESRLGSYRDKTDASAISCAGWPSNGPVSASPRPTSRMPTALPNWPSATSPPKWSGSSLSFKALSADCTRELKENPTMSLMRFTITIALLGSTIQSRGILPDARSLWPTNWTPSWAALLWDRAHRFK